MAGIQLYVDGSSTKLGKERYIVSWGFIAIFHDQNAEIFGRQQGVMPDGSKHEQIAFVESYLFAKARGFAAAEMSFFTDDFLVAHASFYLHRDNRQGNARVNIEQTFRKICKNFYTIDLYDELIECLLKARFTKVKGHRSTIYNLRADYLAKHARSGGPIQTFENWLAKGFRAYTEDGPYMWLAPFAR